MVGCEYPPSYLPKKLFVSAELFQLGPRTITLNFPLDSESNPVTTPIISWVERTRVKLRTKARVHEHTCYNLFTSARQEG